MKNIFVITACLFLCSCANFSDKISFEDLLSMYKSKDFTEINNAITAKGFLFRESNETSSVWTKNLDYDFSKHDIVDPSISDEGNLDHINRRTMFKIIYGENKLSLTCYEATGLDSLVTEIKDLGYVGNETEESKDSNSWYAMVLSKKDFPSVHYYSGSPNCDIITLMEETSYNDTEKETSKDTWDFAAYKPNGWANLKVFMNSNPVIYDDENTDFYESRAPLLWMACNLYASLYRSALGDSLSGAQIISGTHMTQDAKEAMEYANDNMYLINNLPLENSSISTEAEKIAQRTFYDNRTDYDYGATEWERSYGRVTFIIGRETHPRLDYIGWKAVERQYFNIIEIWRGKDNCMYCKKGLLSLEDYNRGK